MKVVANLAPTAAASFLWSPAEQKDIADGGTKVSTSFKVLLQEKIIEPFTIVMILIVLPFFPLLVKRFFYCR